MDRRVLGEGVIRRILVVAALRRRDAQFNSFFVDSHSRLIPIRYLFDAGERPVFQFCIQGDIFLSQRKPQLGRRLDPYALPRPRGRQSLFKTYWNSGSAWEFGGFGLVGKR